MSNTAVKQTGPKTQAGKQISSKNAQQYGIFTKGYLASENHAQLDALHDALCQQWGATDPTRQIIVQGMHQAAISANRLALAQQQMMDAAMQSPIIRQQFADLAEIDAHTAQKLPAWFFQSSDHPQKEKAIYLAAVWDEAFALKAHYSDQLVAQAQDRYPNLYHYVMSGQKNSGSFAMACGQRFKQNVPSQNLAVLTNEINEKYPYHLIWAQDPERYEIYIAGLRAKQVIEGMDLDKTLRYSTAFQNQHLKACQALDALDRLEGKRAYAVQSVGAPQLGQISAALEEVKK